MNDFPTISTPKFPPMPDIDISTGGVEKLLADFDVTKATGPYDIQSRIQKMGAAEIAPALTTSLDVLLKQAVCLKIGDAQTFLQSSRKGTARSLPTIDRFP